LLQIESGSCDHGFLEAIDDSSNCAPVIPGSTADELDAARAELGPLRLQIFATGDTVALSFVFDKFYLIMD
jgi:hypothetical protein